MRSIIHTWNRASRRPSYDRLLQRARLEENKTKEHVRSKVKCLMREGKLKEFSPLEPCGKSTRAGHSSSDGYDLRVQQRQNNVS